MFLYQGTNSVTVHEPILICGGPRTGKSTFIKSITNAVNYVYNDAVI